MSPTRERSNVSYEDRNRRRSHGDRRRSRLYMAPSPRRAKSRGTRGCLLCFRPKAMPTHAKRKPGKRLQSRLARRSAAWLRFPQTYALVFIQATSGTNAQERFCAFQLKMLGAITASLARSRCRNRGSVEPSSTARRSLVHRRRLLVSAVVSVRHVEAENGTSRTY